MAWYGIPNACTRHDLPDMLTMFLSCIPAALIHEKAVGVGVSAVAMAPAIDVVAIVAAVKLHHAVHVHALLWCNESLSRDAGLHMHAFG